MTLASVTHTVSRVTKGWDSITADPGVYDQLPCPVCGKPMSVERGVRVILGWAHAIAVANKLVQPQRADVFTCEHFRDDWHRKALSLRRQAATACDLDLATRLDGEANSLVRKTGERTHNDTSAADGGCRVTAVPRGSPRSGGPR